VHGAARGSHLVAEEEAGDGGVEGGEEEGSGHFGFTAQHHAAAFSVVVVVGRLWQRFHCIAALCRTELWLWSFRFWCLG